MKSFQKIFWILFIFLVACEQKNPSRFFSFSISWEWQAPQNAFIQDVQAVGNYIFLTLNTGNIGFFPLDRPDEIRFLDFADDGVISIFWFAANTSEAEGIVWTTTGNNQNLIWFSLSLSTSNTNKPSMITQASLTYNQIYGISHISNTLFWAADGLLFSQQTSSSFLPSSPESIPFPYPFRIWGIDQYQSILYIVQGDKGLTLVDQKRKKITNYSWIIGSISSLSVLPREKRLILADRINGIRLYDIQSPWKPSFLAVYETLGNTMDIALTPSGLWLADQYNGISFLQLKEDSLTLLTNIQGRVVSHVRS
ncbi:MAG: hypothetical protein ACK4HQ_08420, partial [Brevinematales bacterium]